MAYLADAGDWPGAATRPLASTTLLQAHAPFSCRGTERDRLSCAMEVGVISPFEQG